MHPNDKANWEPIKRDYVEGVQQEDGTITWPSLAQLSEEYDVSRSTLGKRAANEDWQTQKNMYRTKVESKRREKKSEHLASEAAQFDIDVFKIAKASVSHVQAHFLRAQQELVESGGRKAMPTTYLNSLTIALERAQRIGRLALGEPLEVPGVESEGDKYYLIQEIISDDKLAERIRENYRSRVGGRVSAK